MHVRGRAILGAVRVPPPALQAPPLAALVFVLLALVCPLPAVAAPDAPTVVSWLSGQRERNGIPGALTEQPDWSAACAAHMSYIAQNGGVLTHQETTGAPGYSSAGSWAGMNSVLSTGSWTTADHDPFENAPIHLAQMLAPAMATSGASNGSGLCITTWPGYNRAAPAATTIYTYPGPGTTIYPVQNVRESPLTPQAALGLSENGNGPTIYAFGVAPSGGYYGQPKLVGASLTGPAGAVPVVTADWTNTTFGSALPPGTALIIPTTPLQNGATYTAHVTMRAAADTQDVTRDWSFVTGATTQALPGGVLPPQATTPPAAGAGATPAPATTAQPGSGATAAPAAPILKLSGSVRRLGGRTVRVRLIAPAALIGRPVRVVAVAAGGRHTRLVRRHLRATRGTLTLRVPRRTVALVLSVPASGAGSAAVATLRLRVTPA